MLETVHNENQAADVDWRIAFSRETDIFTKVGEQISELDACRNEYVLSQVKVGEYYSVQPSEVAVEPRPKYFHLVQIQYTRSRAHLMPTIETPTDISRTAPVAFLVQFLHPYVRLGDVEPAPVGSLEVYEDGEQEWMRPFTIADPTAFSSSLMRYGTVTPSMVESCMYLADGVLARPPYAIMDAKCPVFKIIAHLKSVGWRAVTGHRVHTPSSALEYDCAAAPKFRSYFQCLCTLSNVLPLTSSAMPSRQPIAYYASLLQGLHVEPYQGAQVYQLALKEHCKKHGVLDRSVHPAIADFGNHDDGDDDGIICCTVGEEDGPHAPARTGGVHIVRPGPASDTGIGCEGRPAASSGAGGASAAASSGVGGAGEIDDGIIVAVAPAPKGLLRKRKRKRPELLKYSALDGAEISYDE